MCTKTACCVVSLCIVVLFAAAISIGILIFLPKMVQSNLDTAEFVLNNVTMITCDGWDEAPYYAVLVNNASMQNPGPVKVTIHDYEVTLSAYMCKNEDGDLMGGAECQRMKKHTNETVIGNFTAPENSLQTGDNIVTNIVQLNVNSAVETNGGFIIPILQEPQVLVFQAESVDVSIPLLMGFKVKGLMLTKRMMCSYNGIPPNPDAVVTSEQCPKWQKNSTFQGTAVAMNCTVTKVEYKAKSPFSTLSSGSDDESIVIL